MKVIITLLILMVVLHNMPLYAQLILKKLPTVEVSKADKKMGKEIAREQLVEILQVNEAVLDDALAAMLKVPMAYTLNDASIIVVPETNNPILYTYEEMLRLFKKTSDHFLTKDFISNAPEISFKLSTLLCISLDSLDGTVESLALIDTALRKVGIGNTNEDELIDPLVAYFGQVLVNYTNGQWKLKQVGNPKSEIYIKGADGKLYDPYNPVTKILINAESVFSFKAEAERQLFLQPKLKVSGKVRHPLDER